jgi:hypothetical protein
MSRIAVEARKLAAIVELRNVCTAGMSRPLFMMLSTRGADDGMQRLDRIGRVATNLPRQVDVLGSKGNRADYERDYVEEITLYPDQVDHFPSSMRCVISDSAESS